MAIDLATLRKLETLPASGLAAARDEHEPMVVLVRLRKGATRPTYVAPRAEISAEIFSAVVQAADLRRLEGDPAVESIALSRDLPVIR